ncbi:MAG TPA: hypothetical protein VGM62_12435 [Chthoniobacterales bacterium]
MSLSRLTSIVSVGVSLIFTGPTIFAVTGSGSDYSITTGSIDIGGVNGKSTAYSLQGSSIGGIGVGSNPIITNGSYAKKPGFVGQLYDLKGLKILATSTNVNERATRQLQAVPQADDNTIFAPLDPATVTWSIVSGPLTSISNSGLATADTVYQDTAAVVAASAEDLGGQLQLSVLNVTTDDFGAYANDQIDDDWQIQYFGQPPNPLAAPNADADGTGQTNLFKFVVGLNPLDGSKFRVNIAPVPGQPGQKSVIFAPVAQGRTYVVQYERSPADAAWNPVTNMTQTDNGSARTVTDLNASDFSKFYRVQISKP